MTISSLLQGQKNIFTQLSVLIKTKLFEQVISHLTPNLPAQQVREIMQSFKNQGYLHRKDLTIRPQVSKWNKRKPALGWYMKNSFFLCVILGSIKVQRPSGGHKVPAYRVVHLGVATNAKLLLLDPTWSQYGEDTVLSSDSNGT